MSARNIYHDVVVRAVAADGWAITNDPLSIGENNPMDKIDRYREIVQRLITEYAGYKPANGEINTEAIIDRERDHYEVINVGWDGYRRVHGSVIHIDIKGDKVWIEHNGTNQLIADQLVDAGVPKEDIVLGFHPANLRQHTGFGVG